MAIALCLTALQVIEEGAFATLRGLQNMSLSRNSLHTLPSILPRYLKYLSLHHNLLQEIPYLSLQNLTFLNLCYNSITTTDPQQVRKPNIYLYHSKCISKW